MAAVATQAVNTNSMINQVANNLPEGSPAQRKLLVAGVVSAAMALMSPLRPTASLALRSIVLLSSAVNMIDAWNQEGVLGKALHCGKIALLALGIVGLAVASPLLIAASIAADIAIQVFEAARALSDKNYPKACMHMSMILIDALALAAVVTASWKLMAAATGVSAAAMTFLALGAATIGCEKKAPIYAIDALCYTALIAIGLVGADVVGERLMLK